MGDEGLTKRFQKFLRILRPGGVLILEPQPWSSYQSNKRVSERALENFKKIKIFPQDYPTFLTEVIGFHDVRTLQTPDQSAGFKRPILAAFKMETKTTNQTMEPMEQGSTVAPGPSNTQTSGTSSSLKIRPRQLLMPRSLALQKPRKDADGADKREG